MRKALVLLCLLTLASSVSLRAAALTPGNVVVLQCAGTSASGNAGSLVEYAPGGGTPVQTIPLTGMTFGGTTLNLQHDISLSADGAMVIIPGYASQVSAGSVESAPASTNSRVFASVKWDGSVYYYSNSSTTGNNYSSAAFRGVAGDGFGNFWAVTTGGGFWVSATNSTAASRIFTSGSRGGGIYNGQLYISIGSAVQSIGSGMPTSSSSGSGVLTTVPNANVYAFALPAGAPTTGSTAYVGNYSGSPTALYVYSYNSGWSLGWTLTLSVNPAHLAADYNHASPIVYFTAPAANNSLLAITDPGASGTPTATTLATASGGAIFRGVSMAPTQPAVPSFTTQPSGATVNYGDTVNLVAAATGANPNAWTWKHGTTTLTDNGRISGSTTPNLTISGIIAGDAGSYYAIASNNGGTVSSTPAVLALVGSCITPQLVSRTNAAGTTATFTAGVSGCQGPIASYSWVHDGNSVFDGATGTGSTISGSGTAVLTISSAQDGDAGLYTVTLIDGNAQPSSSAATLTVVDLPGISQQPADQDKPVGATANFTVTAAGGLLSYNWFKSPSSVPLANGPSGTGSTISGAGTAHLVITSVQTGDAGTYSVTVTNLAGSTPSSPATLTIGVPPSVSTPTDSLNVVGSDAAFAATVTAGTPPFTYTWKHNGALIANDGFHIFGADTATLGITNVDVPDRRLYSLSVSNAYGGATASAQLYVIINTNKPNDVANLIVYEPFDYPTGPNPAVSFYSWENLVCIYNRVTGQPAHWVNTGGGLFTAVVAWDASTLYNGTARNGGLYPYPGIDCAARNRWTFSSSGCNNHLSFGGVTNGAAYFSFIFTGDQGGFVNNGTYDVVAGFTSGNSDGSGNNANNFAYTLCSKADDSPGEANPANVDGPGGWRFGVFKGGGIAIGASSVNGQFASKHLTRGHPYLVVGCYKFNSGTNLVGGSITNNDVLSLWVEPAISTFGAAEANLPIPDAGGMITNWNANAPITEFAIRATLNTSPFSKSVSDLRIGKTWASVTGPYYPKLSLASDTPNATLGWPAKDSFGGYGYQLRTSADLVNWSLDANAPVLDFTGNTNTVTETPVAPQFWQLIYPPRSGNFSVY